METNGIGHTKMTLDALKQRLHTLKKVAYTNQQADFQTDK